MTKLILNPLLPIKPYEPSKSIAAKLARRTVPYRARRLLKFNLRRPIVSFTFDDFPRSAIINGSDVLEQQGWRSTFYVASGLMGQTNHHGEHFIAEDIRAIATRGHEIAGHTFSHTDCDRMGLKNTMAEIDQNTQAIIDIGHTKPIKHFAYPFGSTNASLKYALQSKFKSMRGVDEGVHRHHADLNGLKSMPVFSGTKLDAALSAIHGLKAAPAWLTLFAHDIRDTPSQWGCTPEEFKQVIDAVKQSGAIVLPIGEAISALEDKQHSAHAASQAVPKTRGHHG